MNWLAHLFLSSSNIRFRIANVLADVIKGDSRRQLEDEEYQRGLACHRAIDRFTDSHPAFLKSVSRLPERWHQFRGILVDIYYDHLLAREWSSFHTQPLLEYTREFYTSALSFSKELPQFAREVLEKITHDDRLASYATPSGIHETLTKLAQRISQRVGKVIELAPAMLDLTQLDRELQEDFAAFFPDLANYIKQWMDQADLAPGKA